MGKRSENSKKPTLLGEALPPPALLRGLPPSLHEGPSGAGRPPSPAAIPPPPSRRCARPQPRLLPRLSLATAAAAAPVGRPAAEDRRREKSKRWGPGEPRAGGVGRSPTSALSDRRPTAASQPPAPRGRGRRKGAIPRP